MSVLRWKFLEKLTALTLQNVAVVVTDSAMTAFGKLQGQVTARPMVYVGSSTPLVAPQIVTDTVQTAADGTLTITFPKAFKTGTVPRVTLTALSTLTSQPTVAELSSTPTATQCVVKTYRTKTQGVLIGGTINPTKPEQAFVTYHAIGEAP